MHPQNSMPPTRNSAANVSAPRHPISPPAGWAFSRPSRNASPRVHNPGLFLLTKVPIQFIAITDDLDRPRTQSQQSPDAPIHVNSRKYFLILAISMTPLPNRNPHSKAFGRPSMRFQPKPGKELRPSSIGPLRPAHRWPISCLPPDR